MPKRGENIHKRKDGRWEGRYIEYRDEIGRAKYKSVYGKTYHEVKEKMYHIRKEKIGPKKTSAVEKSFEEVLWLWLETNLLNYKPATENKYRYMMEVHIIPELGRVPVSQITTLMVNTFLRKKLNSGRLDKKGGLSAAYVRSMMLIINAALEYAVNEQFCQPLRTPIYRPTPTKKELPIFSVAEQKKLETYLLSRMNRTNLGILISLHTGLRIGEICALSWEDIDMKEKVIHVRATISRVRESATDRISESHLILGSPKTKASVRDIPISSDLNAILKEMYQYAPSNYVISDKESFISPRTYEYRYHKVLEKCGLSSLNYHALRHTFATRCIEVGVDVKTLSEILGHSNVSTTLNTYVHSSMDLKRMQLEKLDIIREISA